MRNWRVQRNSRTSVRINFLNRQHFPTAPMHLAQSVSAFALMVAIALPAGSAEVTNSPEVGVHQPILTVEKNVHPENKMVIYTKLDTNGRFAADPANRNAPILDFYWLMDGRNYKAVHPLIKTEIRKRFICQWGSNNRSAHFLVDVNDLKEVRSDITDPKMEVYARETSGGMKVEAQMNLGPSDGKMRIRLSSIYTEGRVFPPGVDAVTLKGEEMVNGTPTGKKVTRRYAAAGGQTGNGQ
jgi:hypothetical protein